MNNDTGGSRTRWRGLPRRAGIVAVAAGVALLTACSGGSSTGGSGGPSAAGSPASSSAARVPGAAPSAGNPVTSQKQLAYGECMRSHGVPDYPTSIPALPAPSGTGKAVPAGGTYNPNSPQVKAALQACRPLTPGGASISGGPAGG